jgi:hypothetical protein
VSGERICLALPPDVKRTGAPLERMARTSQRLRRFCWFLCTSSAAAAQSGGDAAAGERDELCTRILEDEIPTRLAALVTLACTTLEALGGEDRREFEIRRLAYNLGSLRRLATALTAVLDENGHRLGGLAAELTSFAERLDAALLVVERCVLPLARCRLSGQELAALDRLLLADARSW